MKERIVRDSDGDIEGFKAGTIARCNRHNNEPFVLEKDVFVQKENKNAYRICGGLILAPCGQMDSHWIFLSDNQEV